MGKKSHPLTRAALARKLKKLAVDMHELGVQMEYTGGFDAEIVAHAHELLNASAIAAEWARGMEADARE